MPGTRRTSTTHFSRIARRLNDETDMGYQKALSLMQDQADRIMSQGPRLDAAGCDMALRLLKQDIEYWGPGIGAHTWPQIYHPVSMTLLRAGLCEETAERAREQEQPEPCGSDFDPSYLAAAGVEPLDYGDGPDEDWLLYLDPGDEQQAGALLRQVRAAAGIVQPDESGNDSRGVGART